MSKGRKAPEARRSAEDYRELALAMHEAEPAPGLTVEDLRAAAQSISAAHGISIAEVAEMLERVAERPIPVDTKLLERLNARYAGARFARIRRPRR